MAGAYGFDSSARFGFVKHIATGDGDTTLVSAPGAGRSLVVQGCIVVVTTTAAQAFNVEDSGGSAIKVFVAPASLAVGSYPVDAGPTGLTLTANTALEFDTAAAGVGATISGFGYIKEA